MSSPASRPGWEWRLVVTVLLGLAAGFGVAWALGFELRGLQAGVVAALTFAAGGSGRARTAIPVAAVLGTVVVVYSSIGALTTGYPWAAAIAMALVAFTTSVMTAAQPVGLLVGLVASYAYWLITGIGVIDQQVIGRDLSDIGVLGLLGLVVGLALVAARAGLEQALGSAPAPASGGPARGSVVDPILTSVRTFDEHAKDGVRRAVALGVAMFAFQSLGSHNAYWVMLTVFVILGPKGRPTLALAAGRVCGTFVGVLVLVALAQLLPEQAVIALAFVCLALSLAASTRSTTVSAAFGAVSASVLVSIPSGQVVGYAGARLVDTLIGATIAIACGWLLWPRTAGSTEVPGGLAEDASQTGLAHV